MLKIIFLDIDGVLNTTRCIGYPGKFVMHPLDNGKKIFLITLDPDCVNNLNQITDKTCASIVISSSWRLPFVRYEMFDQMVKYLKEQGVTGNIIDYTPVPDEYAPGLDIISFSLSRGREIDLWVCKHHPDSFVCIDDDIDMAPLENHLVHTVSPTGLTQELVPCAVKILDLSGSF